MQLHYFKSSCLFLFCHGDNTVVNQGFKQDILDGSMVIANKDVAQVQKHNLRYLLQGHENEHLVKIS